MDRAAGITKPDFQCLRIYGKTKMRLGDVDQSHPDYCKQFRPTEEITTPPMPPRYWDYRDYWDLR